MSEGSGELDEELPVGRRDFLLLGASLALAGVGLAGCAKRPAEKILPYHRTPPELTPGNPLHYATAMTLGGFATGLLVQSREGRPVKVEGNPDHPASLGAAGPLELAQTLALYDPHRARQFRRGNAPSARSAFLAALAERAGRLERSGGAGLWFLLEPSSSPLLGELRARLARRFPAARFVSYAPLSEESRREGARLAFGRPLEPLIDFRRPRVVLSLDEDFLQARGPNLAHARAFAERREVGPRMSRLYVVEPALTVTGMFADHRLRLRGSDVEGLARALTGKLAAALGGGLARLAEAAGASALPEPEERWLSAVARDLAGAAGEALVVAGPRQPPRVHALVHALNLALGAHRGERPALRFVSGALEADGPEGFRELARAIEAGSVGTLVITARNPVYAGFANVDLGGLLPRVEESVYLTPYEDETARRCTAVAPALHLFETWGDARAHDGTVSLVQPLIEPLIAGVCEVELFATLAGELAPSSHRLLKEYWRRERGGPAFEQEWERWLQEGVISGTEAPAEAVQLRAEAIAEALRAAGRGPAGAELELAFAEDYKVYDGRFANNPWLQELPDPVTKLTWDNAALMSPRTAASLGVKSEELVELTLRGRTVEAPVLVVPGHADGAVTLPLGYGRAGSERVAAGVGFDAYQLRHSDAPWYARGLTVRRLGRRHPLAVTQEHWTTEGRPLAIAADLGEAEALLSRLESLRGPLPTLHEPVDYSKEEYRWAMSVDLNRCTGCMACVVACQAENNIPVVGKEDVLESREMHWLRVDRYFSGAPEEPRVITQPMACVHCETAPCEYVCPVNATVHSDEGLNEMVYNRCLGTRYCSNNCPYKVRRFNYSSYHKGLAPTQQLAMNPDVTVRARGVMEKCTYCVQRIERRRIEARLEGRRIRDGELVTACQQACPTEVITFGSLNDPEARVTRLHRDARRYDVLHGLGTRPRTAYLARIRNPNPELG